MMKQSHGFRRILPIPFLPLGAAGLSYLVEKLLSSLHLLLESYQVEGNPPGFLGVLLQKDSNKNSFAEILNILQQSRILTLGIYNHYLVFLILMMIIHIGFNRFKSIAKKKNMEDSPNQSPRIQSRNLLSFVLYYTISFLLLQFLIASLSTDNVRIDSETQPIFRAIDQQLVARRLEHKEKEDSETGRLLVAQKPVYLKTVNEIYVNKLHPICVVYSLDFKTAFVVQKEELTVYNVSKPRSPIILGHIVQSFLQYGFTVLSLKRPILFLMREDLQILDISNLTNPTVMSKIELGFRPYLKHQSTLVIDSREKYAICTGPRIKIFDISDLSAPEEVFFSFGEQVTTVLLSGDDKTAYIGSYGFLQIWNVQNFQNPAKLGSFPVHGNVLGSVFSQDQTTIFLVCGDFGDHEGKLMLNVISITDPRSPVLQREILLDQTSSVSSETYAGMRVTISPDSRFLVVRTFANIWMINVGDFQVVEINDAALKIANIGFLPDKKNALIFSAATIRLSELYLDIPPKKSTSLQPNYLSQISLGLSSGWAAKHVIFAPLGRRAFVTAEDETRLSARMLLDIDLQNPSKPFVRQTMKLSLAGKVLFTLSSDEKDLYYLDSYHHIHFINIQGTFVDRDVNQNPNIWLRMMVAVTKDKKTLYSVCLSLECDPEVLYVFDISDLASPQLLKKVTIGKVNEIVKESELENNYLRLSSDEQTLFYLNQKLQIIDVSDRKNPVFITAFDFDAQATQTFAFTSDYKTCFVISSMLELDGGFLKVIDLGNYHAPRVIHSLGLPVDSNNQLVVSLDDKFLFMSTSESFITLDISNKTSITVADVQSLPVSSFFLTENDENVVVCYKNSLQVFRRKSRYALGLSQNRFKIGNTYSNPIKILELNNYNNYRSIGQDYKLIQASLHSAELKLYSKLIISDTTFPSWISLNKESATLSLDLTNPVNSATHKICLSASTEVSADSFMQIKDANYNKSDAQNLQAYLFGQGYLDYERFLTPNFEENAPLLLSTQYSEFEQEIRQILKSHRIEVIHPISIESSLELQKTKPLQIKTPSMRSIRLTIELASGSKFVTQAFSAVKTSLTEQKTLLFLEGVLININEALNALLINVGDEGLCPGTLTISDGLNMIVTHRFEKMSDFMKTNEQPKMNPDFQIQSQVDKVLITAGEHFIIELSEKSFADLNNRPLSYALEMPDKSIEIPDWITIQGRTLTGTPPEQYFPYWKEFCIKVSNEYKSTRINFTLTVKLSFVTILKRVLIVVGYLVTAYKAWQHSDKFYNILFKKYYRYGKILRINTHKEISERTIFPIILIRNEVREAKEEVAKVISERMANRQLIDSFVDSENGGLKRERLNEAIENSTVKSRKYEREDIFGRELVQQLIANELTMKRLGFSDERKTLDAFEKIKSKWINLVSMNPGSAQFFIKDQILYRELQAEGILQIETAENSLMSNSQESNNSSPTKRSIEKELIIAGPNLKDSQINIGLLKDAIIAHAFDSQNIYSNRNNVNIQSKEITNSDSIMTCLMSFLRFDMNDLAQHSTKRLGYGLKYKLDGDKVIFYGKLEEHLNNKTLVVQIIQRGGYLLREIFIEKQADGDYEMVDQMIEDVQEEL